MHTRDDVATTDVAGAYLKATMKDVVFMKFHGESVDILCEMNPKHERFVTIEQGKRTLYVRLIKAIYGCVKSALLWYELFSETLKKMGFKLNPYDPCVANCMIEGKQCTIVWYVDDNKISHVDPRVVGMVIERIESRFDKMTVTRGREHEFLGMSISYTGDGTATIAMKRYLQEAIDESQMVISRGAATPAKRDLFEIDETSPRLNQKEAVRYQRVLHMLVARYLRVTYRTNPST
jgi:hypothetical protein